MLQFYFHMMAIATICYNPSNKFVGSNLHKQRCLKNTSFDHSFSASRSSCGGFVPEKLWLASAMDGFIRASAFRDGKSDEHVQVLQQEAFIDVSQPKFLMESTLNRLVGVIHILPNHVCDCWFYFCLYNSEFPRIVY